MTAQQGLTAAPILLLPIMGILYIALSSNLSRNMRAVGFVLAGAALIAGIFVVIQNSS